MTAAHNSELIDSVQTVNRLHWTKVGVRGDASAFILPTQTRLLKEEEVDTGRCHADAVHPF